MSPDDHPDDFDERLDDGQADLEARFQELERDAEIERLKRQSGTSQSNQTRSRPNQAQSGPGLASFDRDGTTTGTTEVACGEDDWANERADDSLSEMKGALDSDKPLERYLLVLCPACKTQNRMSLTRVRTAKPICGRCKQDLSFTSVG